MGFDDKTKPDEWNSHRGMVKLMSLFFGYALYRKTEAVWGASSCRHYDTYPIRKESNMIPHVTYGYWCPDTFKYRPKWSEPAKETPE